MRAQNITFSKAEGTNLKVGQKNEAELQQKPLLGLIKSKRVYAFMEVERGF